MRAILLSFLSVVPILIAGRLAAESAPTKNFRPVHLTVLQIDGKPAAHRDVYLRGWSGHWGFRNWGPINEGLPTNEESRERYGRADGWRYSTDDAGKVTVPIGDFAAGTEFAGPGWGIYAFLIDAGPEDAGGVSSRFSLGADDSSRPNSPEWGKSIPMPRDGLDLTLQIQSGITVKCRVVDDRDLKTPLAGVEVSAGTDLEIGTRSEVGNHIFYGTAKTDRDGRFVIHHRFPNILWVDLAPALWTKTKINGVWTEVDNRIMPPSSPTGTIDLEMAGRPDPAFHYSGRLTDFRGHPMGGVQVELTAATEPQHFHEHHFMQVDAKTQADGTYTAVAPSPWVTGLGASIYKNGSWAIIAQKTIWMAQPLPPGHYDLKQEPPAPEKAASAYTK